VDGTGYVIGVLFIKGMTPVTTPVSLGIYLFYFFDVLFWVFQVEKLLAVAEVAGGVVCLHCW